MYSIIIKCLDGNCAPKLILSQFSRFWPIVSLFLTTKSSREQRRWFFTEAISTLNLVAPTITYQEFKGGGGFPAP